MRDGLPLPQVLRLFGITHPVGSPGRWSGSIDATLLPVEQVVVARDQYPDEPLTTV